MMKTLYHGTSSINLSCIKTIGLSPGHAKGGDAYAHDHHMLLAYAADRREPSVFLTDRANNAADFARYAVEEVGGKPVVITLHVPNDVFDTFMEDELYERDFDGKRHAWRAHSVDVSCVGEVRYVTPKQQPTFDQLVRVLSQLLSLHP